INVGATLGQIIVGFLAQSETFRGWLAALGIPKEMAWHFGFGAAAVGMFFGLVQYVLGDARMGEAGKQPTPPENEEAAAKNRRMLLGIVAALVGLPALVGILVAVGVPIGEAHIRWGMLILLLALAAGIFVKMFTGGEWSAAERKRLWVIFCLFFGAIFFFG